ncbi:Hydroxymethylglutaryl-CoA reductase [Paraburkholderia piptadeniae]|uniref:Hydroxymethylglutaryl-CoA reductase n=2 Tax=Paraburkholderia TaxID=1822464 RepID=A0A7X1NB74_9BURK|nr:MULTISPECIES: hydroxymethylglutaryl-CoA reductase [Paraburkholderia]MPW18727.1 hydroxymethylglutaryl-CoA reductase [Paraburkholderia franconis]SIT48318.1 Hydroxymethylglutaryl-CoA reductase [Paraburkholderia piptadeniae]
MKIPRFPENDYSTDAIATRLHWLEDRTGRSFPYLAGERVPTELVTGTCENVVGFVGVPVGVAGPVRINGVRARGDFVVPLATTEGTLVASFSRGMRIITASGGCSVTAPENSSALAGRGTYAFFGDALIKVSAVVLRHASLATQFDAWLRSNAAAVADAANDTSRYARVKEISPLYQGDLVGLSFVYETGQAMGLNMATKANEAACRYILANAGDLISDYYNTLGGDKRFVPDEAKGRYVSASVLIPREALREIMRTTAARMNRFLGACNTLLAQRGATAPNIHVSNALTALFIACGQDPAFVTVSFKNATTSFEPRDNGDLLASVTLPNMIVGTVGGGTRLPVQRECLAMINCEEDARKLSEIAAAVALAGEISVAGAITANEFTRAHTTLGRGVNSALTAAGAAS